VATAEPRKNLVNLIEAYARARRILKAARQELPRLVLTGLEGWGLEPLRERVREAGVSDRVTFTGYVPDAVLPALYRQAFAFVFPSVYEGFGMPVLEAMACGCPALIARAGSLPEVAGDAAAYFNPRDTTSMARALANFVAQPQMRVGLRQAGLTQCQRFTWDATAKATLALYRHVLSERA
jgi:glycosyltransferase involved in cell wall biosynthesis